MTHLKSHHKNIKPIKQNKKGRFFTLLEVCFFFIIVTIVYGFVSIPIKKSIETHRTEKNFRLFKEKIFFIKKAALFNQADLFCSIKQKDKGIFLSLGCNDKRGIFPWQKRQKSLYPYLKFQFFPKGKDFSQEKVSFTFTAAGNIFPKGKIKILGKDGKFFKEIDIGE